MFEEIPTARPDTPLLDQVDSPADLRAFKKEQLPALVRELREFMLYSVGQTGGAFWRWTWRCRIDRCTALPLQTHQTTGLFGTSAIKLIHIKSLPVAETRY